MISTAGTPFAVTGTVVTIATGEGLELVTEGGTTVIVYGLGSLRYWNSMGVDRPAVGDEVSVSGYTVVYDTEENIVRNIATIITVGGVNLELRDAETGLPLWRQYGGQGQNQQ
jgi:ABC-type enterochelin transport system substrate-binding protein